MMQFSLSRKKAIPAQQEPHPSVSQQGSGSIVHAKSNSGVISEKSEAQLIGHEQNDSMSKASNGAQDIHNENLKRIRGMDRQEVTYLLMLLDLTVTSWCRIKATF